MGFLNFLFGGGAKQIGTVVEQVGGVFQPNAERNAARAHEHTSAAMAQYAAEYHPRVGRTWFDSFVDGLNRLVRPVITLSILGVLPSVMIWPEKMVVAFSTLALLPAGYWAGMTIIMGFYFGGRMQMKAKEFERSVQAAVQRAPEVIENMRRLRDHLTPGAAHDNSPDIALDTSADLPAGGNKAVDEWRKSNG